jgi:hypothetical protein
MTIWFDMDGTIADLYGVEGWLEMLIAENPAPYATAKALINLNRLARILNKIQKEGNEIGIISWLSKSGSDEYGEKVTEAKLGWLKKHLGSVKWNSIEIVKYGTNKYSVCREGILFDDEAKNRNEWKGEAYEPEKIFEILKKIS